MVDRDTYFHNDLKNTVDALKTSNHTDLDALKISNHTDLDALKTSNHSDLQSLAKYDVSRLDSFDSFITVTTESVGLREFDVVGLPSIDVGSSYSVLFYLPSLTGTGDAGFQILNTGSAVYCCRLSNGDIFVSNSDARPIHDIGDISGMNKSFCCKVVFTRIA